MTINEARALAESLLASGDIRAYCVEHGHDGTSVMVETEQGWDPYPLFSECAEPVSLEGYL